MFEYDMGEFEVLEVETDWYSSGGDTLRHTLHALLPYAADVVQIDFASQFDDDGFLRITFPGHYHALENMPRIEAWVDRAWQHYFDNLHEP